LHEPQCNIVAFRHAPAEVLGRFQFELRRKLVESGQFYIVSTKIDDLGALRVTIINPSTTPDHLDQLMDAIRRMGRTLIEEMR
jgi:L-2,4-diaminobutyrate decarboxylase